MTEILFARKDDLAAIFGVGVLTVNGVLYANSPNTVVNTAALTNGQLLIGQTGSAPLPTTVNGDGTLSAAGSLIVTKTNGVVFATSATTDTTNATNIISGTLAAARMAAFGSGDVSFAAAGGIGTIAAGVVTYAKFQTVAAVSLVGNPTGALATAQGITLGATLQFSGTALQTKAITGDVTASANSYVTALVNIPTGVTMAGLIDATAIASPAAPAAGIGRIFVQNNATNNLKVETSDGNATQTVRGFAGTLHQFVVSLDATGVFALAQPAFSDISGTITTAQGGLGLTAAAVGDLIFASATTPTWSRLADVATGSVLVSGGVNTAPAWSAAVTITTSITSPLHIGGSTSSSTLTLESTSGAGTTDSIIFKTASQSTRGTILSNGNVGFGLETNPQALLVVSKNATTGITFGAGTLLGLANVDGSATDVELQAYGTTFPRVLLRQARGTAASKTATQNNDLLFILNGAGWDATNGFVSTGAIAVQAAENFTSTAHGTFMSLLTTPIGSTAITSETRIMTSGALTAAIQAGIPAGGTAGLGLMFSSTPNYGVFFGSGAPALGAAKGSLYLRSDGTTTNNRSYINTDGGTTWTAITTVA